MLKQVTFFDGGCADCQKVAAYLSAKGIDYERKNIKAHPEMAQEAKNSGAKTFPAVFVNGHLVEGWNEGELNQKLF